MTTVMETVRLPASVTPTDTGVDVQLVGADGAPLSEAYTAAGETIVGHHAVALTASGTWSLDLDANSTLTPAGTVWRRSLAGRGITTPGPLSYATVPAAGGPYRWDEILDDPPATITATALAAHAADTTLHGGGQLLGYADRDANFTTASTDLVDVPGASITFDVPAVPYVVEVGSFCLFEEAAQGGGLVITLGDDTQIGGTNQRGQVNGDLMFLSRRVPVPNHFHAPAAGTTITYKMRANSSAATSDLTLIAMLFSPDAPYIIAHTL